MAAVAADGPLNGFWKAMEEAKLVPPLTRRMIIDINMNDAVQVYYECFGDEKMFELLAPSHLGDAVSIGVTDAIPDVKAIEGE